MERQNLVTGRIDRHLKAIAIPSAIGMLFNTLFNVVDTFYAGRLDMEALAGMSLSFPVFFLILAFASGLGAAATTLLANALGREDGAAFHRYIYNSILMALVVSLFLFIFGQIFGEPLLVAMGAQGAALRYAVQYMTVIFYGSLFFVVNMLINGILIAQGDSKSYRNFLIVAFLLNLLLDPLLIYGWFGLPRLATAGVAVATIITQALGVVYLLYKLLHSAKFQREQLRTAAFDWPSLRELIGQGVPAALNKMTISLGVFVINYFVSRYAGDVGLAAYGAAVRVEQIALLPALGLNAATQTIVGQNYGANKNARIYKVYRQALLYGVIMMSLAMLIIYPTADRLIAFFNDNGEVIAAGAHYLRIAFVCLNSYVLMGISIALLQGLKKPVIAIYVGLYRQLLMPLIVFYLLGSVLAWGVNGVWYGIVLINWSAAFFTLWYTHHKMNQMLNTSAS